MGTLAPNHPFALEQAALPVQAAREPAQPRPGGKDAMARDEEGDWVGAASLAHGPRAAGFAEPHRHLKIV